MSVTLPLVIKGISYTATALAALSTIYGLFVKHSVNEQIKNDQAPLKYQPFPEDPNYPLPPYLEDFENVIKIAVTGGSGVGKSTFVNTMRGLLPNDDEAAPVGVTETTMKPTGYCADYEGLDVVFWDLPGCGTNNYPQKTYIKDMGLKYFDNILFLNSGRFRECDTNIAKELRGLSIPAYFVRTKANIDFEEEEMLGRSPDVTKQAIIQSMRARGIVDDIYFVSRYRGEKYQDPYKQHYDYADLQIQILCNLFRYRLLESVATPKECEEINKKEL